VKFEEWAFFDISSLLKEVENNQVSFEGGSPKFIHFLKSKLQGSLEKKKIWIARNRSYDLYSMEISLFKKLALEFYQEQQNWFNQWAKLSNLRKLVLLLEFIFERNKLAHNNYSRGRRHTQFSKKSKYLENAIYYAETLDNLEFFDWGQQYDNTPNYPVIMYFQFENYQISFHCDIEVDKEFSGKWNGIVNVECPIDLKKILHLMMKYNVNETKISRNTREVIHDLDENLLESKLQQKTKIKREVKIEQNLHVIVENSQKTQTQKRFKTLSNFLS
jgi:hypothetical protein